MNRKEFLEYVTQWLVDATALPANEPQYLRDLAHKLAERIARVWMEEN